MNKIIVRTLFVSGFGILSFSLQAQQRTIDMELLITSPAPGSVFQEGTPIDVVLEVKNNGPDVLVAGDSLVALMPNGQYSLFSLSADVAVGASLPFFAGQLSTTVDETSTVQFCAQLLDDPGTQATIDGVPLLVSYLDPDSFNNALCREVTIELGGPSSVTDAAELREGFRPYPNPARDWVYLPVNPAQPLRILIYDMLGNTVYDKSYAAGAVPGQGSISVPVSGWAIGMYQVLRWQGRERSAAQLIVGVP